TAFSGDDRLMATWRGATDLTVIDSSAEPNKLGNGSDRFDTTLSRMGADGRRLFTAGQPVGRLWNLDTGQLIATTTEPDGQLKDAVFNRAGTRLITWSDNG